MYCYVALSNIFQLMHMKMCIELFKKEAAKKGWPVIRCVCIYYCCVRVNTVKYGCYFHGNQFFMISLGFFIMHGIIRDGKVTL